MKIGLKQIRKLIQEQLLQEQIFGNQAIIYHGSRSNPNEFYQIFKNNDFQKREGVH